MGAKMYIEVKEPQWKSRDVKARENIAFNWKRDSVYTSADFSSHIFFLWFLITAELMIVALQHFFSFQHQELGKSQSPGIRAASHSC